MNERPQHVLRTPARHCKIQIRNLRRPRYLPFRMNRRRPDLYLDAVNLQVTVGAVNGALNRPQHRRRLPLLHCEVRSFGTGIRLNRP